MDRAVSRIHAEVAPRDDGLWVKDLGSRNGTFVAGVKVHDARVPSGASIRFGTTEIAVTYEAPEPPAIAWEGTTFGNLHASSAAMREVFASVAKIAKSDSSVMFVGEAGTGKHALARAMHDLSDRANAPFVVLDCSALLPDPVQAAEMIEEALQAAEGGTLLLDEPAELSILLQRELVPPLDAKVFRVVATSQRDLRPLVNQGAFRESLYFRLAGNLVGVPPLRERLADLPFLLRQFLGEGADAATAGLVEDLAKLPWASNVRELELYARRLKESGGVLRDFPEAADPEVADDAIPAVMEDPFSQTQETPIVDAEEAAALDGSSPQAPRLPAQLEPWFVTGFKEFRERWIELGEREYLRRLMKRTNRASSVASREAGLERTYLYRLLKKHGV